MKIEQGFRAVVVPDVQFKKKTYSAWFSDIAEARIAGQKEMEAIKYQCHIDIQNLSEV
jgi:hypothetical protein